MKNTQKVSEPLLINRITLKGSELEKIFNYISKNKEVAYTELLDRYIPKDNTIFSDLNDDILKDSIGFLLTSNLLEISINSRSWIGRSFIVPDKFKKESSFKNLLLKTILNLDDIKQRGLSLVHKVLIEKDILHIQNEEIVKIIERSEYSDLFSWNEEKINFWSNLFDYCRIIKNLKNNGVWVVPNPEIIIDSLNLLKEKINTNHIPINLWVSFFQENFGYCLTKKGRLNRGFTMAFELLEEKNLIKIRHKDDSLQTLMIGTKRTSEVILL